MGNLLFHLRLNLPVYGWCTLEGEDANISRGMLGGHNVSGFELTDSNVSSAFF